jgi:hypothetical protein
MRQKGMSDMIDRELAATRAGLHGALVLGSLGILLGLIALHHTAMGIFVVALFVVIDIPLSSAIMRRTREHHRAALALAD